MWTLKILVLQQRKLKWKKVRGAILSSMEMSSADIEDWRRGGGRIEAISRGRKNFRGGILAWVSRYSSVFLF